jgi:transposase
MEERRFEALDLLQQGLSQAEVGGRLKVAQQSVSRWALQAREPGRKSLRKAGRAGRKPQLAASQRQALERGLVAGPAALGYETPLWTCARVAHLIEKQFGVSYHPAHVWKVLRQLGWSGQRPGGHALERKEAAIAECKKATWPALKKKPKKKAEPSF